MAAPPAEVEPPRSTTTIDSLPVEILTEVLLRVPTPAALVHAAATSRSWRGAIANPDFLARYRKRHRSSPFLGLYVPRQLAGPPSFHIRDSIHCAGDDTGSRHLKNAALKAVDIGGVRRYQDHRLHDGVEDAFILGGPQVHPDCRLLDCHNSRLLLTRGDEALEVRSPLARDSILVVPFPPDVLQPDYLDACLLQGHDGSAAAAFRVIYLQHRREGRNRQVRAVEYESTRKSWQEHPWQTIKGIEGPPGEVMHAGHRMFCRYRGRLQAAVMLDTRKMEFSVLPLPTDVNFTIGEIEDSVCCLVEAVDRNLFKVWKLEEKMDWKLEKDISLDQVLAKHVQYRVGYYSPRAISNGIALVCSTTLSHHFVLDLNTCSLVDMFEFQGRCAYIMQMPWPPAFSHSTVNAAGGFDQHGEPASMGDARTGAGIEGLLVGASALVAEPAHADLCQTRPEPSIMPWPPTFSHPTAAGEFDRDGEPASVGDSSTVAGELEEIKGLLGGAPALAEEPVHVDTCQTRPEPSPSLSLGCCFNTEPVLSTGQVPAELAVHKPDANMAETSEGAERIHKDGLNQDSEVDGQKQDKECPPTRRVNDSKERKREWYRARWHARSQEQRERERERDRARWQAMSQEQREHKIERMRAWRQAMSQEQREHEKERDRVRWHARSREGNKRRREAYMIKQKQQPNIKNINDGDYQSNKEMSIVEDTSPYTVGSLMPAMNLGRNEENQPKLRDRVAALNYLLSNEPQDLDIQDPTATAPTAPPAAPSEEPEEPLLREQSLNHDLMLQPRTLARCTRQGGKLDGEGSHDATTDQGRRRKMPNPKYLGAEWLNDDCCEQ